VTKMTKVVCQRLTVQPSSNRKFWGLETLKPGVSEAFSCCYYRHTMTSLTWEEAFSGGMMQALPGSNFMTSVEISQAMQQSTNTQHYAYSCVCNCGRLHVQSSCQ
jgi:hypothetical protein